MEHQFVVRLSRWKQELPGKGNNNPWIVTRPHEWYYLLLPRRGRSRRRFDQQLSAISSGITVGLLPLATRSPARSRLAGGYRPLYVGFYDQNTGNVYADQSEPKRTRRRAGKLLSQGSDRLPITSSSESSTRTTQAWSAVRDKSPRERKRQPGPVVITGPLTNEDLTLSSANSAAVVMTQSQHTDQPSGNPPNYSIGFNVNGCQAASGGGDCFGHDRVVIPADIANNAFNGNSDKFNFWTSLNGATPKVAINTR